MVCYGPRITTLAITGAVVYVFFHRLIGHILHIAGLIFEITLITCAGAAALALLIWTTRRVQRRRAAAGACTQCRYRCQQALIQPGLAGPALAPHRHLPVVQITRRQAPARPGPWPAAVPLPAAVAEAASGYQPATPAAHDAGPATPTSPPAPARPARPVSHLAASPGQPCTQACDPVSHGGYLLTAEGVTSACPADHNWSGEPALDRAG